MFSVDSKHKATAFIDDKRFFCGNSRVYWSSTVSRKPFLYKPRRIHAGHHATTIVIVSWKYINFDSWKYRSSIASRKRRLSKRLGETKYNSETERQNFVIGAVYIGNNNNDSFDRHLYTDCKSLLDKMQNV